MKRLLSTFQPHSKRFYSPLPRRIIPTHRTSTSTFPSSYTILNPTSSIIKPYDGIYRILSEPTLVIERQIEMMNLFLGFEQANHYQIMDALGNRLGYMVERDLGLMKAIMRQIYRLHRPFHLDVFNNDDELVMTIKRPFSFINSHIKAILPSNYQNVSGGEGELIIGESIQKWHLWRRRYDLFIKSTEERDDLFDQFGSIDSRFLSFDFPIYDETNQIIASIDRNFGGLTRELFTDTGVYIIRMDPASFAGLEYEYPNVVDKPLDLDKRAVLLGNAVSIDFDYFSRHSNGNGGFLSFGSYE